ncbi:hypothetical protein D6825_01230 [Candidatus Woesearchaeota archaeon]|nr:MAG: hypothetical protein D6825_01230 [Candidatus Woesearchaeota archaeon]
MNKAQSVMQVLVFILAGIIFLLIIGYGYKSISYFLERQEQVQLADFWNDLETSIESIRRQPGTVRKVQLPLPSKYAGVCFFDKQTCGQGAKLKTPNRVIDMSWASDACRRTKSNVFVFPRVGGEPSLDISVSPPGYVCIPNSGGITVRVEGLGRSAKVSEWE